jgi:hypothetical protein
MAAEQAQRGGRAGCIHQHEPTDYRVEQVFGVEGIEFASCKSYIMQPGGDGATFCRFDGIGRAVDAEHRSGRPNQPAGQQGYVADAATNIEYSHSLANAGSPQQIGGQVSNQFALLLQSPELALRVTQRVGTCIGADRMMRTG